MRQIILDTETTGLDPAQGHRIIEIGCVELINRKITQRHYHQYIRPERDIDAGALAVHGISESFLADKPVFAEIAEAFLEYVGDDELIIHNASFDLGFLNAELRLIPSFKGLLQARCSVVDTLLMARQLHVGQRNSLDALCKRYSVDNSQRELHGALLDAHLLARVYLAMTGGQATLFGSADEQDNQAKQTQEHLVRIASVVKDLPVILADEAELQEHHRVLELIRKKGKCVWD